MNPETVTIADAPKNVLQASIGTSSKRARRLGRYHVSDLHGRTVVDCARLYAGIDDEDEFPAYLSARGLALEDLALRAVPADCRQVDVEWHEDADLVITGHPDALYKGTIYEVKSQLREEDDDKEARALDQALTYAGFINMGADVNGAPAGGDVARVEILLMGLWKAQAVPYEDILEAARERAEWTIKKAYRVHALAKQLLNEDQDLDDYAAALREAEQWDQRHPVTTGYSHEIAPILEGEQGEAADEAVAAYVAWKRAEKEWAEHHKLRWEATLDLKTKKKVKAPCGGTITLRKKDVKVFDPEVYAKLDGLEHEQALETLRNTIEADVASLREAAEARRGEYQVALERYEQAKTNHADAAQVVALNQQIAEARETSTRVTEEPNGILCSPPRS